MAKDFPWKINLGSGQRKFGPGWVNVDCQAKWEPDVHCSGADMPFEDCSAQMIVLHHVLEHFGLGEADKLIRECRRVLQPGGSLIVTVPHLADIMDAYRLGRIDNYTLLVNLYGAYMGDKADRHKWGYPNHAYLFDALDKAASWQSREPFNFRPIEGADIARDWWIMGVEAIK